MSDPGMPMWSSSGCLPGISACAARRGSPGELRGSASREVLDAAAAMRVSVAMPLDGVVRRGVPTKHMDAIPSR